jgi:hypothetical protein
MGLQQHPNMARAQKGNAVGVSQSGRTHACMGVHARTHTRTVEHAKLAWRHYIVFIAQTVPYAPHSSRITALRVSMHRYIIIPTQSP